MENSNPNTTARLIGSITLILLILSGVGTIAAADLPQEMVIGYQAVPNPETIVKQLGWNEKDLGVPIKWVRYDSGKHVVKAFTEGRVDVGLVGTSPAAAAIAAEVPLEVIYIHDIIGDSEALVVKNDAGINTIGDLAGKRVAAPFGSTTHYHLMVALKLANIRPDQVTIINQEPGQMRDAWKKGQIDAGFVWEPMLSEMMASGGKVLLSSRELAQRGFPTADLCLARKAFTAKYPGLIIKYLRNLDRAVRLYRSDPDQAARAVARAFGTTPEISARQLKGLLMLTGEEQISGKLVGNFSLHFGLYTLLKETADFLQKAGEIKSSPPYPAFMRAVNPSYVLKAQEEYKRDVLRPKSFE